MPVPLEDLLFVERASCPFLRIQRLKQPCASFCVSFGNWQDASSTRRFTFCGTGILPVPHNPAPQAILRFILRFAAPIPKKLNPTTVPNQVEGSGTASAF